MTDEQFTQLVDIDIPCALFHVMPTDLDDEHGVRCDELILLRILNANPTALKHKPLSWFIKHFITNFY